MIYADSDFFMALLKPSDWLKSRAQRLYEKHKNDIWTSPVTVTELMLLSVRDGLDLKRLIGSVLEIAKVPAVDSRVFLVAAHYIADKSVGVFDALHAAYCGKDNTILSSDKVFDRIGMQRIKLEAA